MNFPLYLARRLRAAERGKNRVARPAVTIATAGVAVGVAVMVLSISVVMGFKHTIRDKVVGFADHIQITNFITQSQTDTAPIQCNDSLLRVLRTTPDVTHIERFAYKQGILKTDSDFLGINFKGVGEDFDTTFLVKHLVAGRLPNFSSKSSSQQLVVSQTMARTLQLKVGQRVFAYFIDDNGVRMRRFTIAGIYDSQLTQFDRIISFTDLHTVVRLNGWKTDQVSGIGMRLKDMNKLAEAYNYCIYHVNRTVDKYNQTYSSQTIIDLYPQIFSWLSLLDLNVWIILALMVSVAAVTMVSGLLIIILERTTTIGLLKALGAHNSTIRHTFLWLAVFVIGRGLLVGNAVALAIILLQKWTGIIHLNPETYYVSHAPVELHLPWFLAVNALTFVICVFVLVAPSFLVSHIHPSKSMRYE